MASHIEDRADTPGRSGHFGDECEEEKSNQEGCTRREQPPPPGSRDVVMTCRSKFGPHYAALASDRAPRVPSLRQRTGRLRMTRVESSVHEPLGNTLVLSNMVETM